MLKNVPIDPSIDDIRESIYIEIEETPEFLEFSIEQCTQEGNVWRLEVDVKQTRGPEAVLDESLEGAAAWWPGPPKGSADVLSVIPDSQEIHLRFATSAPPSHGKTLRIYPPHYLEALQTCWDNNQWAQRCLTWLQGFSRPVTVLPGRALDPRSFSWLRLRQTEAFQLAGVERGFLWGPPGTGKTTTLGALLAQYLVSFPQVPVLLLSTTNSAVDLALVAVDKALEQLAPSVPDAAAARKRCRRIGNHFTISTYSDREHLLPARDTKLLQQVTSLEARRPEKENVRAYAEWKLKIESVRAQLREHIAHALANARLVALTTTRAVFNFETLAAHAPYDLIVFDEASQVGLAHALALAPLAKSVIFAGDPQQLSPIVRSKHNLAQQWLGKSMFVYKGKPAAQTCQLNEQSRMAEPICNLVSGLFYDGDLVVAQDCQSDQRWMTKRSLVSLPPIGDKSVSLYAVEESGTWSQKYRGNIRYQSAKYIEDLVGTLTRQIGPENILILTPFRAQRALIRSCLRQAGHRQVAVSTVHRAQGRECHTVLFDPVQGDSPFLQTESAEQLINVALSRAQARLVVFLSPEDQKNPLLRRLVDIIEYLDTSVQPIPIQQFALQPDFPDCALAHLVQIGDVIGKVVEVNRGGGKFALIDVKTGKRRPFRTAGVIEQYGQPAPTAPVAVPHKMTHLKAKASQIIGNPNVYYWTPPERKEVRAQLGINSLGDAELARQFLQALNKNCRVHTEK